MANLKSGVKNYWQRQPTSTKALMVAFSATIVLLLGMNLGGPSEAERNHLRAQIDASENLLVERAATLEETEARLADARNAVKSAKSELAGLQAQLGDAQAVIAAAEASRENLNGYEARLAELEKMIADARNLAAYVAPDAVNEGIVYHKLSRNYYRWINPNLEYVTYDLPEGGGTFWLGDLPETVRSRLDEAIKAGKYLGSTFVKLEPGGPSRYQFIDWDLDLVMIYDNNNGLGAMSVRMFSELSEKAQNHLEALRPRVAAE